MLAKYSLKIFSGMTIIPVSLAETKQKMAEP